MPRPLMPLVAATAAIFLLCHCGKEKAIPAAGGISPDAWPGYTLIEKLNKTVTDLIDMEGRTVHRWTSKYNLAGGSYMLEDGSLLRSSKPLDPHFYVAMCPGMTGLVERINWDGELLWSYRHDAERYVLHHDVRPLPNGNVIMLVVEAVGREEQTANGRDPATLKGDDLWVDTIIEVKPTGKESGDIVWKWRLWDHLIQDFDSKKKNYGVVYEHPELIDVNFLEIQNPISHSSLNVLQSLGYVGGGAKPGGDTQKLPDWTHANALDYNADLDQILISLRCLNEFWIIDHGTTMAEAATNTGGKRGKGGALLCRWGNPQACQLGGPNDVVIYGQHDVQWIDPGLPGAGSILLFNNGDNRKDGSGSYSSVDQIKLPFAADGTYQIEAGQPFGPRKAEWTYVGKPKESFYSQFLSGAQRLPNGNTLICSGLDAKVFEVTSDGRKVWDWKYDEKSEAAGTSARQGPPAGGGQFRRPGMGGGKGPPKMGSGAGGGKGPPPGVIRRRQQFLNPLSTPDPLQSVPATPASPPDAQRQPISQPPAAQVPRTQPPPAQAPVQPQSEEKKEQPCDPAASESFGADQLLAQATASAPAEPAASSSAAVISPSAPEQSAESTPPAPAGGPGPFMGRRPMAGAPAAGAAGQPGQPPRMMAQRRAGSAGASGPFPQPPGQVRLGAYRAVRYGIDHPAFKGKKLEPLFPSQKPMSEIKQP